MDVGYGLSTLRGRIARGALDAKYRALFDNSVDAVLLTAPDGAVLNANPAACELFGRSEKDICQAGRSSLVDSQDPRLAELLEQRERTGKSYGRLTLMRSDGSRIEAEVSSSVFETPHGPRTSMVIRDVTERARAERELQESEERYRLLLEQTPAGIAVHQDNKIAFINPAGASMLGFSSPEELVGKPISELVAPEIWPAAQQRAARVLAGETETFPIRQQGVRKDGSTVEVEVRAVPIVFEGRSAVQTIVTDITEREEANRKLVESEQRYRALFENMSAGFVLFEVCEDEAGQPVDLIIKDANQGFETATGLVLADVIGRRLTDVLPGIEKDPADWIGTYGAIAQTSEPRQFERLSELLGRYYSVAAYRAAPKLCAVTFTDVTDRKQAEARAKQQAERFRRVFESANVGKSITLTTGQVITNQAFAEMLGYSPEELGQKRWQELTPRDEIAPNEAIAARLLCGEEQSARFNKRFIRKDGEIVWADVSTVLVRDEANEPAYFITTVVDITETKKAADALQLSEERFSSAFFASPAGLTITCVADGQFIEVNDAFLKMFELARDEVIGSNSVELGMLSPAERAKLIAAQVQAGGLQDADLEARAKSGRGVSIVFSSRPITIDGEDCHITTMIDVTSRKEAVEALRGSEERYRRLAENLPDMVWRTDIDGNVLYVNGAVSALLGYTPDEVLDKPVAEYMVPTSIERLTSWRDTLLQPQRRRPVFYSEVQYIDNRGQVVPAELHAVPVFDEAGVAVAIEGVTRDTRERAEMGAQLLQAQKLESVGRLAGGVAHDFNNLLSVIISYAGFATDQLREGDPIRDDILEVQKAGERAAALTRQLLAFSRKQILEPKVLDLNNVVSGMEGLIRRLLGEDIEVAVYLGEPLGSVLADPGQIEQVIMNLAVNARDAMPRGGKLTIETQDAELDEAYAEQHATVEPGHFVLLAVTDTGSGMDAETRSHVFEPFFTTKEKGKGTGLGLSTVYGIVKQSGGNIWVYSEPGRGTTFKVYLPRRDAAAVDSGHAPEVALARHAETVLVVEDEDAVRRLTQRILRSAGYTVHTAASGGDALVLCEKLDKPVDLLLTDVVMPRMSGRELAERLTQAYPGLRVLFMSGYTDNAIVHHGVLDAGTHFLGKPFAAAELTRRVRKVLDKKRE